jgi:hypothetical protein
MSGWALTLDALERQLGELESALEHGVRIANVVGGVPRGLGVLPAELQDRAAAVHRRMRELESILQVELEHTRQLLVLGGTASEGPSRPLLFDRAY